MKTKFILFAAVLAYTTIPLVADDTRLSATPSKLTTVDSRDWTLEVGSGLLISDVRTDLNGYTLVPADLTASLALDDVSLDNLLDGAFRGYTEFKFQVFGMAVVHGIESRFTGLSLGPRYNFVQQGWDLVPFIDGNIGFAFTDSQGAWEARRGQVGQGQDFCFQFGIQAGIRYDINDDWFVRFSGVYTHFSNAGLSEPTRKNRALDAAGPEIGAGFRF